MKFYFQLNKLLFVVIALCSLTIEAQSMVGKTEGLNSAQGFQMPDCYSGEPLTKGWRCLEIKGQKAPFRIDAT